MLSILYEDKYLLAVIKQPGISSEADGIIASAGEYTGSTCYPVHRLDTMTGGCLLIAKTRESAAKFSALAENGGIDKRYIAAVRGIPENETGVFTDLLYRDTRTGKVYTVKKERKGVKDAKLEYRTLETAEDEKAGHISLVQVKLYTGRTHQIRVQFSSRRLPLLGDGKYGGGDNRCSLALWCTSLSFIHPFTKETVTVSSCPDCARFPWNQFGKKTPPEGENSHQNAQ